MSERFEFHRFRKLFGQSNLARRLQSFFETRFLVEFRPKTESKNKGSLGAPKLCNPIDFRAAMALKLLFLADLKSLLPLVAGGVLGLSFLPIMVK